MAEEKKMSTENEKKEAESPEQPAKVTEAKDKGAAKEPQAKTEETGKAQKKEQKLSEKAENIVKNIEQMSVLELSNLVKTLEDRFGVSAAAPVATMAAPGAGASQGAGAEEEKSVFTVVLAEVGPKKINVIKEIRALTNLGLKEAKDLVESAPKEVKSDVQKDEAAKMKKQLEEAGAKIELK